MLNLNNSAKLNLPRLGDGTRIRLTGEELFNSREIHTLQTASTFTLNAPSEVHVLGAGEYISTNPIYEAGVETNGSLDGGIAVKILTDAEAGQFHTGFEFIGGVPTNVVSILDDSGDEVLLPNGDQVFVIMGIKGTVIGTNRKPIDDSLQLSFAVKNDGIITPITLEAGTYSYQTQGIYSWSTARWRELPTGGSGSSGMGGSESASAGEIIDIMNANLARPGYCSHKLTADSNKPALNGYKAVFSLTKDGTISPSFKITNSDGTEIYTSIGTLASEGVGIIAEAGTATMSDITFTFNGETVDPQYVSVSVAGNSVKVTLDNMANEVTSGLIYAHDRFGIVYTKPAVV